MSYHAWYSEKMAMNGSVVIYKKSSVYEDIAYATLLTDSSEINPSYDDIKYVGIVYLQDFIQKITNPTDWIVNSIKKYYNSKVIKKD